MYSKKQIDELAAEIPGVIINWIMKNGKDGCQIYLNKKNGAACAGVFDTNQAMACLMGINIARGE